MMKFFCIILCFSFFATLAQEHQHHHTDNASPDSMPQMSHALSINLPMTRNGSGTGWLPDATPMFGYMAHVEKWMLMAHGNIFIRYTNHDLFEKGTRGSDKFDSVNWLMLMAQRKSGKKGLLRISTMLSLDALFGGNGYPLLFQTGESWQGKLLVDRQHPHDLFSEISVSYSYAINEKTDVFIYTAYPGEPALGSVAFMHRVSSLYNPDAPLSHHWNDGTHITFGVITAGIRLGKFKLDASSFTGREPDEKRYGFDKPRFDSYSGRLSFNPTENWALQVSQGFAKSPEALHPDEEDVYRTTVSTIYSQLLSKDNFINATALGGLNSSHANEIAVLLEVAWIVKRWAFYGRYEWVEKSREELDLNLSVYGDETIFPINAATAGFSFDLLKSKWINLAGGAQTTFYSADSRLNTLYGKNPLAGEVYIRLYPPRMDAN